MNIVLPPGYRLDTAGAVHDVGPYWPINPHAAANLLLSVVTIRAGANANAAAPAPNAIVRIASPAESDAAPGA